MVFTTDLPEEGFVLERLERAASCLTVLRGTNRPRSAVEQLPQRLCAARRIDGSIVTQKVGGVPAVTRCSYGESVADIFLRIAVLPDNGAGGPLLGNHKGATLGSSVRPRYVE